VRHGEVKGSKQLLFFAYAMAMKGVTQELEIIGKTLQDAFGVIGEVCRLMIVIVPRLLTLNLRQRNQFDALFASSSAHDLA
jgi:hypothetical protein